MKIRNKFINVLLNIILIISSFYTIPTVLAAEDVTTTTDAYGNTLTKKATRNPNKLNTWDIELGIEFEHKPVPQDIILVMDRSGSMKDNNRLANSKTAAKSFIDIILSDSINHDNRIAIISYAEGERLDNDFSTNKSTLKGKIDGLSADGGTFTQLGLYRARKHMQSNGRAGANQIIVLMTDGQPTYGFGLNASGAQKYSNGLQPNLTSSRTSSYTEKVITKSGTSYSSSNGPQYNRMDFFNTNSVIEQGLLESDFDYNNMGGSGSLAQKIHKVTTKYRKNSDKKDVDKLEMLNLFNTNIAEANIVKGYGNTLYTVALDLGNVANAEATLQKMATTSAHAFKASSSSLNDKFKEIANAIAFPYTDMKITDFMGEGFDLIQSSVSAIHGNLQGVQTSPSNLTWSLTPNSFERVGNIYKAKLKYSVEATNAVLKPYNESANGFVDTNSLANFTFTKGNNTLSSAFPKPKVKPTILLVKKSLYDFEGNAMSLIDESNQRTYNYTLNDKLKGNLNGGISTQDYDVYVLQDLDEKTILETSITKDNIARFDRSYYLLKDKETGNGTLLTNGKFKLLPESGINTLRMVNKPKVEFDDKLIVSKSVKEANDKLVAEKGDTLHYSIRIENKSNDYLRDVHIQDTLEDIKDYLDMTSTTLSISRNGANAGTRPLADLLDGYRIDMAKDEVYLIEFEVKITSDEEMNVPSPLINTVQVNKHKAKAEMPVGEVILDSSKAVQDTNGDGIAEPGETLTYTLTVKNTGTALKKDLHIKDDLKDIIDHVTLEDNMLVNGETRAMSDLINGFTMDLDGNKSITITFKVKVKSDIDVKEITKLRNIAIIGDDTPEVEIPTGAPKIVATKSVKDANDDKVASASETLTYTITAENTGTVMAKDVLIKDALEGLTPHVDDLTDAKMMVNGSERDLSELISGFKVDIAAGAKYTITFKVTVKDDIDTTKTLKLYNIATVGTEKPEVEIPTGKPEISASKSVKDDNNNALAEPGEEIHYTITIKNTGDASKDSVFIQDTLSTLLPYIDDTSGLKMLVGTVERDLKDLITGFNIKLDANSELNIIFTVKVKSSLDTATVKKLKNIATVDDLKPNTEINTGAPRITAEKFVVDDNGNKLAEAGEKLHYTITIKNTGNLDKDNLFIQDKLTNLLPHIDAISGLKMKVGTTERDLNDLVTGFTTKLNAGSELTITFTVKLRDNFDASEITKLKNIATVDDINPEVEIETGAPKISATKAVIDDNENGFAEAGEELHYTIHIKNEGKGRRVNTSIQDTLSDLIPHINDISGLKMMVGTTERNLSDLVSGFKHTLEAKSELVITFTVTLKDSLDTKSVSLLTNIAMVDDERADAKIPTGVPNITATKLVKDEGKDEKAEAGEDLHYTIHIKNEGDGRKLDVFIQDTLSELLPHIKTTSGLKMMVGTTERNLSDLIDGFEYTMEAKSELIITFTVTVKDTFDAKEIKLLKNIATVDDKKPYASIPTAAPIIDATKTVFDDNTNGFAEAGERLHYTIQINNTGEGKTKRLFVQDTLEDLIPHIDNITGAKVIIGGKELDISTLIDGFYLSVDAKSSVVITFTVRVKDTFDAGKVEKLSNLATIDDLTPEVEIPTGKPVIGAIKSVMDGNDNGIAEPGELLTYTITVKNTGKVMKKDLLIQDNLDQLLDHIDDIKDVRLMVNATQRHLTDLVDGFNVDLDANETIIIYFTVKVKDDLDTTEITQLINIATVGDETPETEIPTGKPEITSDKAVRDDSGDGFVEAGEKLHYTIRVKNEGNASKKGVLVKDTLKDLLAHVDDITDAKMLVNGESMDLAHLISGYELNLEPDQEVVFEFTLRAKDTLDSDKVKLLRNVATIGDDTPEVEIPTGKPKLNANKFVNDANEDGYAEPGEALYFRLEVSNSGEVTQKDLFIQDEMTDLLPHIDDITDYSMLVNGEERPLSDLIDGFTLDLDAGHEISIEFTVFVKGNLDTDLITHLRNKAVIGDDEPETETPTGKPQINVDKSVEDANQDMFAEPGETLNYTITITNSGKVAMNSLFIQDTLEDLLPYVKDTTHLSVKVGDDTRPLNDLINGFEMTIPADTEITLTFSLTVSDTLDVDVVTVLKNIALIGDDTPEVEIPTGKPVIGASKYVMDGNGNGIAEPGELLTYTITVKNTGKVMKKDLLIQDNLDQLLDHIDDIKDVRLMVNATQRHLTDLVDGFNVDLDANETIIIYFTVKVKDDLDTTEITQLINIATVGDETPETEIPTGKPKITSDKTVKDDSGDGFVEAGENLHYTIRVKNEGNASKKGVLVKDTLKDLLAHVDDITDVKMLVNGESMDLALLISGYELNLEPDQEIVFEFTLRAKDTLDTDKVKLLRNMATIGDDTPEVEIPTGKPKLSSNKFVNDANEDGYAEPGEALYFRLEVSNSGEVTQKDLFIQDEMTDLLPHIDDISFTTMHVNGEERPLSDLIDGFTQDLDAGYEISIEFMVFVKGNLDTDLITHLRNKAVIGDNEPETEIPTGMPKLSATKSVVDANGNGIAEPGETLTYTLTVSNTGNINKYELKLQDTLEDLLPFIVDIKDSTFEFRDSTFDLQHLVDGFYTFIASGETITFSFDVTVREDLDVTEVTTLRNIFTFDEIPTPEVEIPTGKADISAAKSVADSNGNGHAEASEELLYTITVTNHGTVGKDAVHIQDTLEDLLPHINDIKDSKLSIKEDTRDLQDLIDGFTISIDGLETINILFSVTLKEDFDAKETTALRNIATVDDEEVDVEIPTGYHDLLAAKAVKDDNNNGYAEKSESLHYTITLQNNGNLQHKDILVKDDLRELLPYIDSTEGTILVDGEERALSDLMNGFTLDLEANQLLTITFSLKLKDDFDADDISTLTNIASVNDEDVEASIPTGKDKLSVSKSVTDTNGNEKAELGERLFYTIEITNTGDIARKDILITDTLESIIPYVDALDDSTMLVNGTIYSLEDLMNGFRMDIGAKETILITFDVKVKDTFESINIASLVNTVTVDDLSDTAIIDLMIVFDLGPGEEPPVPEVPKTPDKPKAPIGMLPLTGAPSMALYAGSIFLVMSLLLKVFTKRKEDVE